MNNDSNTIAQYNACLNAGGIYLRSDRGLIELTGADRSAWLNNLITNVITTLGSGEGNYAFATNRQGRTVFDANILVCEDRYLLDIDKRMIKSALDHFRHFRIMEAVEWTDQTDSSCRVALLGPKAAEVVEQLGFGKLVPMAWLQHVGGEIGGAAARMMRHDFAGVIGAEFIITGERAEAAAAEIVSAASRLDCLSVERQAVDILRIEAGIPVSVEDIDGDVIPPETGQIERGISHHKGCYLGQEVIERMRSHGVQSRRLVGILLKEDGDLTGGFITRGTAVMADGERVGRVTSVCRSEALAAPLCLGYVKTSFADPDHTLFVITNDGEHPANIVALPVRRSD
ncbi:MAG: YgfZ/GcvT domain-containing protein [Phycisphaerae bacterium]